MATTEIKIPRRKQEVFVTRIYVFPRDLVYRAVTDPHYIPDWWGPRNLTTQVEKMDVRWGGQWRFIQHDTQGNIFAFHGVYHEAKVPELLIYTMEWEGLPGHVLLNIDRFDEQDGKTISTSRSIYETVADRDGMLQQGMEGGIKETTDRIDELLVMLSHKQPQNVMQAHQIDGSSLKLTRVFNASPEKIWQSWFNPNLNMCWWGPKDYSACESQIDARIGGKYLNCMQGPDGRKIWSTGIYKELIEPNRFVCTDSFADEHGNVVPATYYGMEIDLPLELEVEVTLEDLGGKTRLTLEHCGFPQGEIIDQTKQGWNESFDKLDECLK